MVVTGGVHLIWVAVAMEWWCMNVVGSNDVGVVAVEYVIRVVMVLG